MISVYAFASFRLYCLARLSILIYISYISAPTCGFKICCYINSACFSEFITVRNNIFMINDGKYKPKMFLFAFIDIIC